MDLTLKYDARELADALDLRSHGGAEGPLMFSGTLLEAGDPEILGEDWIRVLEK